MPIQSIQKEVELKRGNQKRPSVGPKFTNASKLLITDIDHEVWFYSSNEEEEKRKRALQFVRVLNKTAHICNGKALIRRYCDVPDGLYTIAINGGLDPIKDDNFIFGYPDVEMLVRHKVCSGWYSFGHEDLKVQGLMKCVIENEDLRRMVGLLSFIKRLEKTHGIAINVRIDRDSMGAAINLDSSWRLDDKEDDVIRAELKRAIIPYSFGLKYPIFLNPGFLEIGLIEMLQYPVVALIRDETDVDEEGFSAKPLVFEYDRGSMFALAPIKR